MGVSVRVLSAGPRWKGTMVLEAVGKQGVNHKST